MTVKYSYCYDDQKKKAAHAKLRTQLRKVARALGVHIGPAMLRTNPGGIAVWGETTLHTDDLYIQADPSREEVLVRTCRGRADYTGGRNRYVSLAWLYKDPAEFAQLARQITRAERTAETFGNMPEALRAMAGAFGTKL